MLSPRNRMLARRVLGSVVDLGEHHVAVLGSPNHHSIEAKLTWLIEAEPKAKPVVSIYGHAQAQRAMLDVAGLDAFIDELEDFRTEINEWT